MAQPTIHHHLFEDLRPHHTILTPNRRLSATLHKHYQHYQLAEQQRIWQTPDILPLSSWLKRLWNDYTSHYFTDFPEMLNTHQAQFLWEKIITTSKESMPLLQITETAEIAKSAWKLLKLWQVSIHHPLFKSAEEYVAFHRWAMQFQVLCEENNWLTEEALPDLLIQPILSKKIDLPQKIMLLGFNETAPQIKNLLTACEKKGTHIQSLTFAEKKASCKKIKLSDHENEIIMMARWAKKQNTQHPEAVIGCVIPTLDKIRDRVMQIFSQVFADENTFKVDINASPFNISAGKSFSHYPLIYTALQLLGLYKKIIPIELLSYLMNSPFLGEAEIEHIRRANFDSMLRQANLTHLNLAEILTVSADQKRLSLTYYCPRLAERFQQFLLSIEKYEKINSFREWAVLFHQLLNTLGWPGERSLNSEEYQIVENWLKLLSEFATLDRVAKPVTFTQALSALQQLATKHIFQTKTPAAPIQVLGILEAAALPFDFLWVSGLDDLSWPPQPMPNPFIPKRLQRELHMPHATALRELLYCERLTQQFIQSANEVIFSHAEHNNEVELQASSLLTEIDEIDQQALHLQSYLSPIDRVFEVKFLETLLDEKAPDYQPQEKIRGGSSIIKQQALCPFRAFAEWRLHAQELEKPLPGLRAKDRGNIVHKVLELLWDKLQDQATLLATNEIDLAHIINESIEKAISLFPKGLLSKSNYISLEKIRLKKLIVGWLEIEKNRLPFKVFTKEKQEKLHLNKLTLALRIDRIDELENGKKLIIDYKTGKNNDINGWFNERLEEPQLPLYSLLDPENTVGITFAQIVSGDACFKGISQYPLDMKGIKLISEIKKATALSWQEQLSQWHTLFTQLSDDFCHGNAKVDPKQPVQTCLFCALKPLCRINEEMGEA